jgi:hypothetical protein
MGADHDKKAYVRLFLTPEAVTEHWSAERASHEACTAWSEFRKELPYARPRHLTASDIKEIAARMKEPAI